MNLQVMSNQHAVRTCISSGAWMYNSGLEDNMDTHNVHMPNGLPFHKMI